MHVAMIGTGHVGLLSGACYAGFGHVIICGGADRSEIERLLRGNGRRGG